MPILRAISRATLSLCLLVCALAFAGTPQVNIPDWVRQASAEPAGSYSAETKAVVLLDESTYSVSGAGEYVETYRRVVRILRPEGGKAAEFVARLSKDDKLLSIHAWSIDKDGHQFEVKQKEFIQSSPYDDALYDDIHYYSTQAPAALPGSVVAFEYQAKRHAWLDEVMWGIQEGYPVRLVSATLELPAGWEYSVAWANHAPVPPESLGPGRWRWALHDVEAIDEEEEHRPVDDALTARMVVTYHPTGGKSGTWEDLAAWSYKLSIDRRTPTNDLAEKARSLTVGKTDFDSRVRALTSFIQREVRYVDIEIGIGGWQPHPAADVFRYRYGDCKDKATLLSAMLKAIGLRSELVLVDTEFGITNPKAPGNFFNHVILAIELPPEVRADAYHSVLKTSSGGRFVIFDPTDEFTPFGEMRTSLQGNYMLLTLPSNGELMQFPLLDPDTNRLERVGKFKLSPDGTLSGEVVERRNGTHAKQLREVSRELTEKERTQSLERMLAYSFKQSSLSDISSENLNAFDRDVTLRYKITAANYSQTSGPLLLVRNRVNGGVGFRFPNKPRRYPIELWGGIGHIHDVVEIEIPEGYKIDDLPDPAKADVGFASYQSQTEQKGSVIRYTRDYIVRDPHLPVEKLASLKKFENIILADEFASTVLKKTQ